MTITTRTQLATPTPWGGALNIIVDHVAARHLEAKTFQEWMEWIALPFEVIWKHHQDFIQGPVDDAIDEIIRDLAPHLVRTIGAKEVDDSVNDFREGAVEGHASPGSPLESKEWGWKETGYAWGQVTKDFDGKELPAFIRKQIVQKVVADFRSRVTEEIAISLLKKVWHALNPVETFKAILVAVKKHGWKIGVGVALTEMAEHFVLPTIMAKLTGNPHMYFMSALPLGEIVYAVVFRILGRVPKELDAARPGGNIDWYEKTYGPIKIAQVSLSISAKVTERYMRGVASR